MQINSGSSDINHVHLPDEIQRPIFEIAARQDRASAAQLVRVAKHVKRWIEPVLYECVLIQSHAKATSFIAGMRSKPRSFLRAHIRALGFGETVSLQQARVILAECSTSIVSYASWGGEKRNPTVLLPFIRSLHIRRAFFQLNHHMVDLSTPPNALSRLTHLVIIGSGYSWYQLKEIALLMRYPDVSSAEHRMAVAAPFQTLTHFGVCPHNWGKTQPLLAIAKNLKYFAVIVSPAYSGKAVICKRIRELNDRRVALVEYEETAESWEASIRGHSGLWDLVEELVIAGYYEKSSKWPADERTLAMHHAKLACVHQGSNMKTLDANVGRMSLCKRAT